jgi:hypothetical protein
MKNNQKNEKKKEKRKYIFSRKIIHWVLNS